MAYKIGGKIVELSPRQTLLSKSGNNYDMQRLVVNRVVHDRDTGAPSVDTSEPIGFKLIGQACADLDKASVGDMVIIHFDLRGGKYEREGSVEYTANINVFKVEIRGNQPQPEVAQAAPPAAGQQDANRYGLKSGDSFMQPSDKAISNVAAADDDLPF